MATDPQAAPAYLTETALAFNAQLERIGELGVVVLLGAMLARTTAARRRPLVRPTPPARDPAGGHRAGTAGDHPPRGPTAVDRLFGIRGIGSLYYLCYALHHGLPAELAPRLTALTLAVVAVSIIVHGLSVTPLMTFYGTWQTRARAASARRRAGRGRPERRVARR